MTLRKAREMMHLNSFKAKWPKFKKWLQAHGSEILHPTNAYEAARFLTTEGIGVIYMNKSQYLTKWVGGASEAWEAWENNKPYQSKPKIRKKSKGAAKRKILVASIAERDGWACMYCGKILDFDTATIEHIVPIVRSGFDGIANMTLACAECNLAVGHMSAREKVEYALKHRGEI